MITLTEISLSELRKYVEIAYRGDFDLLDKYWGEDFSLEEAVNETMFLINQVAQKIDVDCYSVENDGEEIGYVVKFPNNLYSFSININHRTKKNLIEYWERIKEVMEDGFICFLYPQNTRAIKYLQRCGMKIVEGVKQDLVTLLKI